jgi:integrase/recombinase XerD
MSTPTFAVAQPALKPGVLQPLIRSYVDHLVARGYRAHSIQHLEPRARHFCYWLNQSDIPVTRVDDAVVDQFARHKCRCPGSRTSEILSAGYTAMVRKFVRFLEQSGIVQGPAPITEDANIQAYRDWLRDHRGLSEHSIKGWCDLLKELLPLLGPDPRLYDAAGLRRLILSESQRRNPATMKCVVTALRSYLRYLATQALCSPALPQAVPSVAHWRHSGVPQYLPAAKVEMLINSCDATTAIGTRDRAILLLLARLGLRAGDIIRLRMDDIDWQHGRLRVCGKGRREANLPLPQEVGDALLKYLSDARPDVPLTEVFLRSLAPHQRFALPGSVSTVVRRALARAGIDDAPSRGARMPRHSTATTLLRDGMPLNAIGVVLRHRSIDTTARYAKVDITALQRIAQPWPGGASC